MNSQRFTIESQGSYCSIVFENNIKFVEYFFEVWLFEQYTNYN